MKILCAFGQHNYGTPERGHSYEYANFLPALRCLGHDVVHFETWNKSSYRDFSQLNRAFLEAVSGEQPDVVFCVLLNYEIWLETLVEVRTNSKAALVNWGTDDSWKYDSFSRHVAPAFDLYVTTSREALDRARHEGHDNFRLSQWAASGIALHQPVKAAECQYQVSFVGSAYGNRPSWISKLKELGIEVSCFGHGWERGAVASEEISRIIRNSVISLNFGDSGLVLKGFRIMRNRQLKARTFEVPGAGGFLLTEETPELSQYYDIKNEIVAFDGIADLERKIRFFLAHPEVRDEIATNGHRRTLREHTYEQRFQIILGAVEELRARRIGSARAPSGGQNSVRFEDVSGCHRAGAFLLLLRWLLTSVFAPFFGKRRGARAARRLVYEVSWRLVGRRTYTAAGLPGRLFYKDS